MKLLLLALILFPVNLYAETWTFVEPDDNLVKSVVAITGSEVIDGKLTKAGVTGVIVEKTDKVSSTNPDYVLGKILTCEHAAKQDIEIVFFNGKKTKAAVLKTDKEADLMLLGAYIHKDVNAVEVYDGDNPTGVVYGLGGKYGLVPNRNNLRVFIGSRIGPKTRNMFLDVNLVPGDSGGPVFYNNKLTSVVSGGWFWIKENNSSYTWPLRGASNITIKEFINGKQ